MKGDISYQTRSDWTFEVLSDGVIHIEDLNLGNMSVTNDAEGVIEALHLEINLRGKKVQYRDSMGRIDRLIHRNGEFIGFRFGPYSKLKGDSRYVNHH